jgi:16S rRNA processing protein RimM
MDFDSCFQLGYVIKSHGLKGEVSVFLDTDQPQAYKKLESVFVEQNNRLVPFFIEKIQIRGDKAVVKFAGVTDINGARALKSAVLWLPIELLPELTGNQFYFHEIVGFNVKDKIHGVLGKVTGIYSSGNQDLIAVAHKGAEVLIPITDDIIYQVDKKAQLIYTNLPDGLLEIYYSPQDED